MNLKLESNRSKEIEWLTGNALTFETSDSVVETRRC